MGVDATSNYFQRMELLRWQILLISIVIVGGISFIICCGCSEFMARYISNYDGNGVGDGDNGVNRYEEDNVDTEESKYPEGSEMNNNTAIESTILPDNKFEDNPRYILEEKGIDNDGIDDGDNGVNKYEEDNVDIEESKYPEGSEMNDNTAIESTILHDNKFEDNPRDILEEKGVELA